MKNELLKLSYFKHQNAAAVLDVANPPQIGSQLSMIGGLIIYTAVGAKVSFNMIKIQHDQNCLTRWLTSHINFTIFLDLTYLLRTAKVSLGWARNLFDSSYFSLYGLPPKLFPRCLFTWYCAAFLAVSIYLGFGPVVLVYELTMLSCNI